MTQPRAKVCVCVCLYMPNKYIVNLLIQEETLTINKMSHLIQLDVYPTNLAHTLGVSTCPFSVFNA